jgi:choline dehydrogenase-like flavoprotein
MTIIPSSDLLDGTVLRAPVAIIGGGAAGISVALRLAERGVASVLVESGVDDYDERTQQLYQGDAPGYWDLTTTRLRQFGGTTNHFNGQSRPLDPIDFGEASWRPGTSWPIDRSELLANLPDAAALLGLAESRWDLEDWFPDATPLLDNPAVGNSAATPVAATNPTADATLDAESASEGVDRSVFELLVFQLRSGSIAVRHRDTLAASSLITVVHGAHATRVALSEDAGRVASVDLATFADRSLSVEADAYVLATGGIESPRLLLASDDRLPAGVGNGSGNVGRYFADHISVSLPPALAISGARWELPSQAVERPDGTVAVYTLVGLTEGAQRSLALPGINLYMSSMPVPFPVDDPDAVAVGAVLDPGGVPPLLANSAVVATDVVPNRESRVTLSGTRNELGERTARLDWRFTSDDEVNMARIVELCAWQLARQGYGRISTVPPTGAWLDGAVGQHHHMGTLRMSATPADGVVDTNQRFHEVANLYAAGSAVFPTYGHVNPTLNLVSLSLRLADHLADRVVPWAR